MNNKRKMVYKIKNFINKLVMNQFFKLFLLMFNLILFLTLIYLEQKYKFNNLIYYQIFLLTITFIFFHISNRIKSNAFWIDHGIMTGPFDGIPIQAFLSGPVNRIGTKDELQMVPVSLVTWLFFCVSIVNQSDKKKSFYHQELVESINEQCPELISWLPMMYDYFFSVPPTPEDFTVEDFLK